MPEEIRSFSKISLKLWHIENFEKMGDLSGDWISKGKEKIKAEKWKQLQTVNKVWKTFTSNFFFDRNILQ